MLYLISLRTRWIPALAVALMVLCSLAPIARAVQSSTAIPEFVLFPDEGDTPYVAVELKPGEQKAIMVHLGNAGAESVSARTYVADAYSLTNGGFGNRTEAEGVSVPATWITYPAETVQLEAGVLIDRTLTVQVPAETKPGQYIAALVVQTADPIAISGSDMFQQVILKSIAIFITVPGKTHAKMAIGEAAFVPSASGETMTIVIQNKGNVLVKPKGEVTITDADGHVVMTMPVEMGSVYAGMTTSLQFPISAAIASGKYAYSVNLEDESSGTKAKVTDQAIELIRPEDLATADGAVVFDAVSLTPEGGDDTHPPRYVSITVSVENRGEAVASSRLTLHVRHDGEVVEDFVLNSALALPNGITAIDERYVPGVDWQPGTYTFSLTLEEVDPQSGQATFLADADSLPELAIS